MSGIGERLAAVSVAIRSGGWEDLRGLLSGRYFGSEPAPGDPPASDRIVGLLADLRGAIPDLSVEFTDVGEGTEEVTATMSVDGTHEHALWGSPGTGNRVAWETPVTVRAFDDGIAVRFDEQDVPTLLGAIRQVGLVNPPDHMDEPPPYPVSIPEFLMKVVLTGQAADRPCTHFDQIRVTEPSTHACAQCVEEGTMWPALRMCLTCGFVGCCDTSKNKHMQQHIQQSGHPMMRSIRLDEGWAWCYPDGAFFERSRLESLG